MRNFDKIFDRGKRNEGDFKRRDSGRSSYGGNRERPQMYDAVCDECGKRCEVPFKPSNDKPIYCSECYSERGGKEGSGRSERRDSGRDRGGRDRGGRDRGGDRGRDRVMHDAICDKCGKKFQLPFRPTGERDVFCEDCYKGDGNAPTKKETNQYKEQFDALNVKLDKLIDLLSPTIVKKEIKEEPKKEEKKEEPKKEAKPKKELKPKKEAKPKKEVNPKKEAKPKKEVKPKKEAKPKKVASKKKK